MKQFLFLGGLFFFGIFGKSFAVEQLRCEQYYAEDTMNEYDACMVKLNENLDKAVDSHKQRQRVKQAKN